MRFERRNTQRARTEDSVSQQRAGIISRMWQAIEFLVEVGADLSTNVRPGAGREAAIAELAEAAQKIASAAGRLVPVPVRPAVEMERSVPTGRG